MKRPERGYMEQRTKVENMSTVARAARLDFSYAGMSVVGWERNRRSFDFV